MSDNDPKRFVEKTWWGKIQHVEDGDPSVYVTMRLVELVALLAIVFLLARCTA